MVEETGLLAGSDDKRNSVAGDMNDKASYNGRLAIIIISSNQAPSYNRDGNGQKLYTANLISNSSI
jgi:hypothetical protein